MSRVFTLAPIRAAERLVSGAALVVLSPVLAVVALLVRHESHGPVIEREPSSGGRGGRHFERYRFRTTIEGAATPAHRRVASVMGADHPRLTATGRILRRTRLDRLPRLLNVVAGDDRLLR